MKRSGQVLLVVMGVTGTTAVGHYLAPPRTECAQQAPTAKSGMPQEATQPCRTTSGGHGGGHSWWRSSSSNSSSSSSSGATNVASSEASGATRGGFGSTGHGISSSS